MKVNKEIKSKDKQNSAPCIYPCKMSYLQHGGEIQDTILFSCNYKTIIIITNARGL